MEGAGLGRDARWWLGGEASEKRKKKWWRTWDGGTSGPMRSGIRVGAEMGTAKRGIGFAVKDHWRANPWEQWTDQVSQGP